MDGLYYNTITINLPSEIAYKFPFLNFPGKQPRVYWRSELRIGDERHKL